MNFVGIDPGKDGGIAIISGRGMVGLHKLPRIGLDIDLAALATIFIKIRQHAASGAAYMGAIEQVHSIHGSSAKSNFEFGESVGLLRMGLSMTEIQWEAVQPKTWQKELFEGITPAWTKNKEGKDVRDTKTMALIAITRLYPDVRLQATARSRNEDKGLVDALCIAHYLRVKYNKEA